MADMSYQDKLADLSQLSSDDLASLEQEVIAAFDAAESSDDLDAMASAADALESVRSTMSQAAGNTPNTETVTGAEDTTPEATAVAADASDKSEAPAEPESEESAESDKSEDGEPTPLVAPPAAPDEVNGDPESAAQDADSVDGTVTAAGKLPPALEAHKFKKKAEDDEDEDDAVTAAASDDDDVDNGDADQTEEDEEDTMTASSTPEETGMGVEQSDIPEERQPIVASSVTTVVAGADIPQRAAGSEFNDYMEVSEAFVQRLHSLRNSRGSDGDQVIVASVQSTVDPERELLPGDDASNFEKIESVRRQMQKVSPDALVASGGYCAPLETRYDIFGVGVTDRPVRDSLAGFMATRGGIRYVQPPVLTSFSGAVGLWTAANDANPTAPTTKPVMVAQCQPEITVTTDAVTLQIQFGNLMSRAYPELVARFNELGLIYHARFAEQNLLSKISALSTAVSSSYVLGTARDVLNSLGRLAAAYRHRHRLDRDTPLRAIMPSWLRDAMREDLTRGHPGDEIEWADAQIDAAVRARNINVTWHIDDANFTGAQNAGAINDFPTTVRYWLFAEGTFLFLDGGTLDLGIVRDSTLVGTNDFRMFVETFEGVAKVGIESIQATVTTHISGAITGTVTPS